MHNWRETLSSSEKKDIKDDAGITRIKILKVRGTDRLLSGKDNSGHEWRGWFRDGCSVRDITWDDENRDGWANGLEA